MNTTPSIDTERQLAAGIPPPSARRGAALRTRLAERAGLEGLVDVAYAAAESPLGELLVAVTPAGVVRLAFDDENPETVLDELATRLSPRVLRAPRRVDSVRRQLHEYFAGRRTRFDLPVDWALTDGFRRLVLTATAAIPYGQTGTYRSVATAAGSSRAVRAAGTALAGNPIPIIVPCHRVLRSDGALGGYRGGPARKRELLRREAGNTGVDRGRR